MIKTIADFLSEIMQARRQWDTLKVLEKKPVNLDFYIHPSIFKI